DIPDEDFEEVDAENQAAIQDIRTQKKYPVLNYPLFIGREKQSSICVPVGAVSRRHAKVFARDGHYYIQDMGSINGTYLNGKRILDPTEMKNGDKIKVGVTTQFPNGAREFVFRLGLTEEEKKAKEKLALKEERDDIIQTVALLKSMEKKKIALRHCTCTIMKRDIFSTLFKIEDAQRVPLRQLDIKNNIVLFYSFFPFKIKDNLLLTLSHPKFLESIKIYIRITAVEVFQSYKVIGHKAEIIKISDEHKKYMETHVNAGELINYLTSTLQIFNTNSNEKEEE
ncbi:MAG TPA: FHA domain-containing protein, partial [Planctomycetota bacterium]|nr:FHA domain-containing protein [Planctomycetota bacterium]